MCACRVASSSREVLSHYTSFNALRLVDVVLSNLYTCKASAIAPLPCLGAITITSASRCLILIMTYFPLKIYPTVHGIKPKWHHQNPAVGSGYLFMRPSAPDTLGPGPPSPQKRLSYYMKMRAPSENGRSCSEL